MTGKDALTFDLISPLLALKDDDDDRRPHLPPIVKPSDCGNATSAGGSVDDLRERAAADGSATTDVPKWIGCRAISLAPRYCLRLSYGLGARCNDRPPGLRLCWHADDRR